MLQKGMALCVSLATYGVYAYCFATRDFSVLPGLAALIGVHCIADLPFARGDMVLHHLFCLGIAVPICRSDGSDSLTTYMLVYMSAELSTVFLVLRNAVPGIKWRNVFNVLFAATFFATRVAAFYVYVVANPAFHKAIYAWAFNTQPVWIGTRCVEYGCIYVCTYGLFLLNLYWMMRIVKKAAKRFFVGHKMDGKLWNEFVTKYAVCLHFIMGMVMYRDLSIGYKRIEMASIGFLMLTSYYYHNSVEQAIRDERGKNMDVLDGDIIVYYLADTAAIFMRSAAYMVMITGVLPPWSNRPVQILSLLGILGVHYDYFFQYFDFVVRLKEGGGRFLVDEPEEYVKRAVSWYKGVPIGLSTAYIMVTMGSLEWATAKGTAFVLIALTMYVRPLYDYNHTLAHVFMLAQAYVMMAAVAAVNHM